MLQFLSFVYFLDVVISGADAAFCDQLFLSVGMASFLVYDLILHGNIYSYS